MFRESQEIGPYTLIHRLGRGGFGEVWLAEKRTKFVTTKVAVKLPLDDQIDHEAIRHEATLWEQASGHPNILPIIDADEYNGQVVIVSEYAPDGSLEQWLRQNGKMSVQQAVEITIQILDGLEFLHSRKIIHRDLKPANILLQGKTPRLADFGISRALRTTMASQSQHISGTFAYMSPEALDGKRSVQTDVWSVGVNLYQFLIGTLPFPYKEPSQLFPAIIMREFEPLPEFVPYRLKEIITKALSKLPEHRYKTCGEMREDLRHFLQGTSQSTFSAVTSIKKPEEIAHPAAADSVITSIKNSEAANLKAAPLFEISNPPANDKNDLDVRPPSKSLKTLSPRGKGIISGILLMLSAVVITPIFGVIGVSEKLPALSFIITVFGGILLIIHALFQSSKINEAISPKRKGIGQGVVLLLSFFLVVPVIALVSKIQILAILGTIVIIIGGIIRLIYAVFFQSSDVSIKTTH